MNPERTEQGPFEQVKKPELAIHTQQSERKRETFQDLMKVRFPEAVYDSSKDKYEFPKTKGDVAVGTPTSRVQGVQAKDESKVYMSTQRGHDKRLVVVDSRSEALAHAELNKRQLGETRYIAADTRDPQQYKELMKEVAAVGNGGRMVIALKDERDAQSVEKIARDQQVSFVTLKPKESLEQTLENFRRRTFELSR